MTEGSSRICVDLSDVECMDSSGVAVLVRSARVVEQAGGRFVVLCPDGPVGWVLQLTGIGKAISIVADPSACDGRGMSPAAAVPSPE
jgi:anti-anti-sigma factor